MSSSRAFFTPVAAFAGGAGPSHSKHSPLEVLVLGSGGPRAFGRASTSYVVLVDGVPRILVDADPGAFLQLGKLEVDLDQLDTVLLTHLHIDHSADCQPCSWHGD